MRYEEFEYLKVIKDPHNPFSTLYEYEDGSRFYIEPAFYRQLQGFKEHRLEDYPRILKQIEVVVKKNRRVIFTAEFEYPQTVVEDEKYIILEIFDITDPLQIYVEDKSRGSDYGD